MSSRHNRGRKAVNNSNGNGRAPGSGADSREDQLRFADMVTNITSMRREFFDKLFDRRRNLESDCGYPDPGRVINATEYQDLYDRECIAARVVELYPKESWQVQPSVFESEDADEVTEFEKAWDALGGRLRAPGAKSWFKSEECSPVWEYLTRADILSGIGYYGVMLLGFDDVKSNADLAKPVQKASYPRRNLNFIRCFPESLAAINAMEADQSSPRYGQPVSYNLTFTDPRWSPGTGRGVQSTVSSVHWSRIIHVADCLGSSEIFGTPRMQQVLYRLLDLRKLLSGSAEMYWQGAFPGIALKTIPQLGPNAKVNKEQIREMMENYANGLQRYLTLLGLEASTLAPTVVDPSAQIERQIEAICILLGCPVRIFKGSERGELASSQDDKAWNDRLLYRQQNYITPRLIVPFVDRLIEFGVLPEPKEYCVWWPDLTSKSDDEKATVAQKAAAALTAYVAGGVSSLVPPLAFLTEFMGLSDETAKSILKAAASVATSPTDFYAGDAGSEDGTDLGAAGDGGVNLTPGADGGDAGGPANPLSKAGGGNGRAPKVVAAGAQ